MNRNYSDISYAESPFGTLSEFMSKTFGWMFAGLLVTFLVGIGAVTTGLIYPLITSGLFILTSIAELVLVFVLSARVQTLQPSTATGIFFAYAVLNGITFSAVFFAYDVQILLTVFALTSLYFGVLAAYGWFTKRDLSGLRPILTAGLIFLLVFWLISMFLPLSGFDRIICFVGLAVFMGLTAYDTQKIKQLHAAFEGDYEMSKKASIFAALQLYLDFINIFLYILRLLGRRSSSN